MSPWAHRVALLVGLMSLWGGPAQGQGAGGACRVDGDVDVDRIDINAIFAARNTVASGPEDGRDADGDGSITVNDGRSCALRCTLPRCETGEQNAPPVADAGSDLSGFTGDSIALDGTGSSDSDGDPLTFRWSLVSAPAGSQAELDTPAVANPNLVVDRAGTYVLELVVDDGTEGSAPDAVQVDISNREFVFDPSVMQVQTLTPDGGSITLAHPLGFITTLEVPAGALTEDTVFTLTRVESIVGLPEGMTLLAAVRLEPSGLDFSRTPRVTLQIPEGARSGLPAIAFLSDDAGEALSFAPLMGSSLEGAALRDLIVSHRVPHFSPGGIVEVAPGTIVPPPPPGADAQTRAQHRTGTRIEEIYNTGVGSILDDPEMFEALFDWFENPNDGLRARAEVLAIHPNGNDLTSLQDLSAEMNSLLEDIEQSMNLNGPFRDVFETAIVETMADVVASYLLAIRDQCENGSLGAQERLNVLSREIVDQFMSGLLERALQDEVFACNYQVTLTPDSQAVFVGSSADIDYTITLEDGTVFDGGLNDIDVAQTLSGEGLQIDFDGLSVDSITDATITVTPDLTGITTLTVLLGAGPEAKAEVLSVPSLVDSYGGSASGQVAGCIHPEDEGRGFGGERVELFHQELLSATPTSAVVGIGGSGTIVTSIDLTVTLTEITRDGASGTAFGGATYREIEIDDGEVFIANGSGSLDGSVTVSDFGNTFSLHFEGSDNFCTRVFGNVLLQSIAL
jgi:hypothetical protein